MNHCWSHQPWDTAKNYTEAAKTYFLQNGSKGVVLNGNVQWGWIKTIHLQHVTAKAWL